MQFLGHPLVCGCLIASIMALYGLYNEAKTMPYVSELSKFHDYGDNQRETKINCNQFELAINNYTFDVNKFRQTTSESHQRGQLNVTDSAEMEKRKRLMQRGCLLEGFLQSRRHWNYR